MTRRWACLAILLLAAGCGGNAITGGGISAGRVEGTVVDAVHSENPVTGAVVELVLEPDGGKHPAEYTAQARTDAEGRFVFTGLPAGEASVRVTPPAGMHARVSTTPVRVCGSDTASLAIAIEPDDQRLSVVTLTVCPESIDTALGKPVLILATALLSNGVPVRPTWIVDGGIGRVDHWGRFVPQRAGSGQIRVRAGELERVIPVLVRADQNLQVAACDSGRDSRWKR